MVIRILRHTSHAIAAHLSFGAVGVEHAHAYVGLRGRKDQDQTIRADAVMTIGDFLCNGAGVGDGFGETIDVNIVVADAVHLGETHDGSIGAARKKLNREAAKAHSFAASRFSNPSPKNR